MHGLVNGLSEEKLYRGAMEEVFLGWIEYRDRIFYLSTI